MTLAALERSWRAHLEYFRRLTIRSGGRVSDEDGVLLWRGIHPLPTLVSGAARINRSAEPDTLFEKAEAFFEGGAGYEILALDGPDDDLLRSIHDRGLTVGDPHVLQFLDGRPTPTRRSPNDVHLRRVEDADDIVHLAAVNRDATQLYGQPDDLFPRLFGRPETVLSVDIIAVVAYSGDEPVATAQVMVDEGLAYVGWVGVVRKRMREGLATMVTTRVLEEGFRAGATCAALSASKMGENVYRRMGFVDVGTFRACAMT